MCAYKQYLDNYSDGEGGEYTPRHRRTDQPLGSIDGKLGGAGASADEDFALFNFDEARRRKRERIAEQNRQQSILDPGARSLVQQYAAEEERARIAALERQKRDAARQKNAVRSPQSENAARFVSRLASYSSANRSEYAESRPNGIFTSFFSRTAPKSHSAAKPAAKSGSGARGGSGSVPKKKSSHIFLKLLVIAGAVFLALTVTFYSVAASLLSDMNVVRIDRSWSDSPAESVSGIELMSRAGVTNILLLGIDDDGGAGSRSDTMMIASLDSRGRVIRLCSILRDNYVSIPDHGSNRINAAYSFGGAALAVRTVESNYRVRIDHYVSVDMKALAEVVDAVGGVDIELSEAEANQVNLHSHCGLTTSSGLQHLNGRQAVTYAQIRKIDSDFNRTGRQRILIDAIIAECRQLGLGQLTDVVKTVAPRLTTDMSSSDMANLGLKALPALSSGLGQMTVPAEDTYEFATISGMSVIKSDIAANARILQSYLYD